jgi:hypothetical protein
MPRKRQQMFSGRGATGCNTEVQMNNLGMRFVIAANGRCKHIICGDMKRLTRKQPIGRGAKTSH